MMIINIANIDQWSPNKGYSTYYTLYLSFTGG